MDRVLERIDAFISSKEPHIVVTADSSGLVAATRDPEFKEILLNADLVTPDSIGIVWGARRAGQPVPERVSGVDIADELCKRSAERGYRIYFLGAAPGVAELAAERMRLRHPGCNIVGVRHGFFPSDSDELVAREVAESKPDVLLVAMGIPRQEKFIARTRHIIRAPVAMGVGGSFDVFSGRAKRAPRVVQRLHLEWMWRLILKPSKFAKAKSLPVFVWLVLRGKR
jgi:N-acetylglucosaminyldiphosphoundecaprenol N-acetyl-beta-D-mannosaminyltransferase